MEQLKVTITTHPNGKDVGFFILPAAADEAWMKRNLPPLLRAAQVIAEANGVTGMIQSGVKE